MSKRAAAAALILGLGLFGAAGAAQARDIIIYEEPPPARVEVVPAIQDHEIWEPGHWALRAGVWIWVPGRVIFVRHPEHHWIPGHWAERRNGWIWVEGHWN